MASRPAADRRLRPAPRVRSERSRPRNGSGAPTLASRGSIVLMVESASREQVLGAALRAADQLQRADYRGWDPFDALASPLFDLPWLRSARLPRLAVQQAVRRAPVNLRPLLRVPEGRN